MILKNLQECLLFPSMDLLTDFIQIFSASATLLLLLIDCKVSHVIKRLENFRNGNDFR